MSKQYEKCIGKWEKKLAYYKRMQERWGKYVSHLEQIKMTENFIKDLKRFKP